MRTSNEWLCDTIGRDDFPGCERKAAVSLSCSVEGRSYALCRPCDTTWKSKAAGNTAMSLRCPLCVHIFLAQEAGVPVPQAPARQDPMVHSAPLRGPLAEAIDFAMYQEGLLIDVRGRVLRRLANDPRMANTQLAPEPAKAPLTPAPEPDMRPRPRPTRPQSKQAAKT
jgi:hypothetical protein